MARWRSSSTTPTSWCRTAELFRALQNGTIDAVQSDDATMASPVDISVFGGYFPFATRYSLDVPALFNYYGLNEIWAEAYGEVENVTWLSSGAWDPLHIFTVNKPIRSLADMNGLRVFGVPTGRQVPVAYGLIPVTVPWDDVEVAMQTGELDGVAWCGFTEAYEVGWADVCNYALTNSVTGAWFGSYFANTDSWNKVPPHLQQLFRSTIDQSHYYRDVWYWGGEAKLRVEGEKMELTSLPAEEWAQVVADSAGFWDEIAAAEPALGQGGPGVQGLSSALSDCSRLAWSPAPALPAVRHSLAADLSWTAGRSPPPHFPRWQSPLAAGSPLRHSFPPEV